MKRIFCLLLLITFFSSCEEDKQPIQNLSNFEKRILNGVQIKLEQLYLMPGKETIPILDEPVDELFKNNQNMVNLIYQTSTYENDYILSGLMKGEIWDIKYHENKGSTIYWEQGYGPTYQIVSYTPTNKKISLTSTNNPYSERIFLSDFNTDNIKYRGKDNYQLKIYVNQNSNWVGTNLVLTVLVNSIEDGLAVGFKDGYIYFDTNNIYELGYYIDMPLTGLQVKNIVDSGSGFENVPFNGQSTIKIGSNYYIPTIGNTYKYVYSDKDLGYINAYKSYYYRFKFKII